MCQKVYSRNENKNSTVKVKNNESRVDKNTNLINKIARSVGETQNQGEIMVLVLK